MPAGADVTVPLPAPGELLRSWAANGLDWRHYGALFSDSLYASAYLNSLLFAGVGALSLALIAWRHPVIRDVRELPKAEDLEDQNPQGVAGASGLALDLGPNK